MHCNLLIWQACQFSCVLLHIIRHHSQKTNLNFIIVHSLRIPLLLQDSVDISVQQCLTKCVAWVSRVPGNVHDREPSKPLEHCFQRVRLILHSSLMGFTSSIKFTSTHNFIIDLGEEMQCDIKVSCPRTQQ